MVAKSVMMTPKPDVTFTPELKEQYLVLLRETGFVGLSAEAVGVTDWTVREHCKRDPEFDQRQQQARQRNSEDRILRALHKRGIEGTLEEIYGGRFKDEVVGTKTNYSDACLLALAKARFPEFRGDADAAGGGGAGGGTLIIPAAPITMDDWEKQHSEGAKGQTGRPKGKGATS